MVWASAGKGTELEDESSGRGAMTLAASSTRRLGEVADLEGITWILFSYLSTMIMMYEDCKGDLRGDCSICIITLSFHDQPC